MLDKRLGRTPRWYVSPPKDAGMRIPDDLLKCVVFLGVKHKGEFIPQGTAFFVSVPSKGIMGDTHEYLVTAQHVVDGIGGQELFVRLNRHDGVAVEESFGDRPKWIMHPRDEESEDEWFDVAVLPWTMPWLAYDYKVVPESTFVWDEQFHSSEDEDVVPLGIGDVVYITGLFTKMHGRFTNLPTVRSGNIAMLPNEPVPVWDDFRKREREMTALLIEAHSMRGLSGAPVFIRETVRDGVGSLYLLGLVHGHWEIPRGAVQTAAHPDDAGQEGQAPTRHDDLNSDITIVVPAKQITDILQDDKQTNWRAQQDKERKQQHLPTPDDLRERN